MTSEKSALCRRDPRGNWSDLHSPPAAPRPRAGPAGAEAPATRLYAHCSADHHLLLLAYGHHRHLQGSAGAHGLGPRRHGVCGDRFTRGSELLFHLPGGGHRSHGALYYPHRSHHHCRTAPRKLLGSLKTPSAQPHSAPLNLPDSFCSQAADPIGVPHTRLWGSRTSKHPKLRLHGISGLVSTLLIQFLRNPYKTHNPRDAASRDPCYKSGSNTPSHQSAAPPAVLPVLPSLESCLQSPTSFIGSTPILTKPRLQVGRLRLLFRLYGAIQSGDWVCGFRPSPLTNRLFPFFWPEGCDPG
ncbi:proline-rich transmembrane protein 1 isoform 3-T3 [Callospermophilus lateralis]